MSGSVTGVTFTTLPSGAYSAQFPSPRNGYMVICVFSSVASQSFLATSGDHLHSIVIATVASLPDTNFSVVAVSITLYLNVTA